MRTVATLLEHEGHNSNSRSGGCIVDKYEGDCEPPCFVKEIPFLCTGRSSCDADESEVHCLFQCDSLCTDVSILVNTYQYVEPLDHQHCLGMEVPLEPGMECEYWKGLPTELAISSCACLAKVFHTCVRKVTFFTR